MENIDVAIVGAGHNGLAAAVLLARQGLKVKVFEERNSVGGATKTETPFAKAPELRASTASYLLGVMPPELLTTLGANLKLIRRDPHYFLPRQDGRYLLFGSDQAAMQAQFEKFFSQEDWKANCAMNEELGKLREDLAPAWLADPLSLDATAEKYVRPELRRVFTDLVSGCVEDYLGRFDFKSEELVAMYSVTDGFSGLSAGFGMKGTGHNFLVHNMCRLPGSGGTFMIVEGGMGAVAAEFARLAVEAGADVETGAPVHSVILEGGVACGVALSDGREYRAKAVVVNADPFRLRRLVGKKTLPKAYNDRLDSMKRLGSTMKINMALSKLPEFACLKEDKGQHNGTIHLLPEGPGLIAKIQQGFEDAQAGQLPEFPTIEWYIHTKADPSLKDKKGRHNAAFFIQWVPYELEDSTWEKEEKGYVEKLLKLADTFAPGFSESVVDTHVLTPKKIESEIGISYGHIHHIDNTFAFDQRQPYKTPVEGLYACGAGCHPAGSVIGAAGHNAAQVVLKDLGAAVAA